jgi:hypothetical protein
MPPVINVALLNEGLTEGICFVSYIAFLSQSFYFQLTLFKKFEIIDFGKSAKHLRIEI